MKRKEEAAQQQQQQSKKRMKKGDEEEEDEEEEEKKEVAENMQPWTSRFIYPDRFSLLPKEEHRRYVGMKLECDNSGHYRHKGQVAEFQVVC